MTRVVVLVALVAGHVAYLYRAVPYRDLGERGYVDPIGQRFEGASLHAQLSQHNARAAVIFDGLRLGLVLASLGVSARRRWPFPAAWAALLAVELAVVDPHAYFVPVPWHVALVPAWLASCELPGRASRLAAIGACLLAVALALWRVRFGPSVDMLAYPSSDPPWQAIAFVCVGGPVVAAAGVALKRQAVVVAGACLLALAALALGGWGVVPLVAAALAITSTESRS